MVEVHVKDPSVGRRRRTKVHVDEAQAEHTLEFQMLSWLKSRDNPCLQHFTSRSRLGKGGLTLLPPFHCLLKKF